jgi:hypothetical protein
MWCIDALEVVPAEFDFSGSGQGRHNTRALYRTGVCLINALDLIEFEPAATQVHVCSSCGVGHCEPGNWVALRRLGECVVWIPAFAQMGVGEWERREYAPPAFMAKLGAPLFTPSAWKELRGLQDGVPEASELPPLNEQDAVRALQWSAPRRVLGVYPAVPQLERQGIVAVSDGEVDAEVHAVDQALIRFFDSAKPLQLVSVANVSSPIEFWLDLPESPAWNAFGRSDARILLLLDDDHVLWAGSQ